MYDRLGNALTFAAGLSATYGEWPRAKSFQRGAKVRRIAMEVKREHYLAGGGCEVCGWRPDDHRMLHAHHVVPLASGGSDLASNVLVLCPNHHAYAHRLGTQSARRYVGPMTHDELLAALRAT